MQSINIFKITGIFLLNVFVNCDGSTDKIPNRLYYPLESHKDSLVLSEENRESSCEQLQRFAIQFEPKEVNPCRMIESQLMEQELPEFDFYGSDSICARLSMAISLAKLYLYHLKSYRQGFNLYNFNCRCATKMVEFMKLTGIENSNEVMSTAAIVRLEDSLYLNDKHFYKLRYETLELKKELLESK
jgi:hypothetical protein